MNLQNIGRTAWQVVLCCWASPYTLLGLSIGTLGVLSRGKVQRYQGVVEFYGGASARFLDLLPLPRVMAITLGHTVIGRDRDALERTRAHERVHVRQFERWGPLMGPAYLTCSIAMWCIGKDAYRDNPFERQAFREAPDVGVVGTPRCD